MIIGLEVYAISKAYDNFFGGLRDLNLCLGSYPFPKGAFLIESIQKEKGWERGTGDEEKRGNEIPNGADRIRASEKE